MLKPYPLGGYKMKINPDTLSLCEEYLKNPIAYEDTNELIIKCVSLEAIDFLKASSILKRYNKVEEAVMMNLRKKDLVEFEKHSNPISFVSNLTKTASYHKRCETKWIIKKEIQEAFPEEKEIQNTIKLINTYTNVIGIRNRLKKQENSLSAIQNKIEEGIELPELLCWMNKEENS